MPDTRTPATYPHGRFRERREQVTWNRRDTYTVIDYDAAVWCCRGGDAQQTEARQQIEAKQAHARHSKGAPRRPEQGKGPG